MQNYSLDRNTDPNHYDLFDEILKRSDREGMTGRMVFAQSTVDGAQAANLIENISGSYQFEKPKSEMNKRGPFFPKTAAQEKILYSKFVVTIEKPASTIKTQVPGVPTQNLSRGPGSL